MRHHNTLGGLRAGSPHDEAVGNDGGPVARGRRLAVALLFAFAIALVTAQILDLPAEPHSEAFDDEMHYAQHALDVAKGGFPRFNRIYEPFVPPLYGTVQAPVRLLSGREAWDWWSRAFNVLLVASSLVPIYCLARRFLSPGWAAIAAAISVASPSQVYIRYLLSENLYIPLSLWLALAVTRLCERPTHARALQAGIVLGLCYLTKTLVIASVLPVLLALIWALRSPAQVIKACVVLGLGTLLLLLPWWFRGELFSSEKGLTTALSYWEGIREVGIQSPSFYLGWIWKTASCFVIGLGTVAFLLGTTGLLDGIRSEDPARRGFSVFTLMGVLATLAMTGIATAQWVQSEAKIHERYLIGFWPLFIIACVVRLRATRVSWTTLGMASAIVLAVLFGMPDDSFDQETKLVNGIDYPSSALGLHLALRAGSTLAVRLLYLGLAAPVLLWLWKPRRSVALLVLFSCACYQGWAGWIAMRRADTRQAWTEETFRPAWDWLDGIVQDGDVLIHHRVSPKLAYHDAIRYEMDFCLVQPDLTPTYSSTVRLDRPPGRYRFFNYGPQANFWLLTDVPGEIPAPGVLSHAGLRLIPLEDGQLGGLDALLAGAATATPSPPQR